MTATSATDANLAQRNDEGDPPAVSDRRATSMLIAVILAVTLLLAGVLTWVVAFSSLFGVGPVTVHGNHLLSAAQVRAAAQIRTGTPLVRLDTADITRRIERLAEVESAQVSTSFPSTVTIDVVERSAVGYVRDGDAAELVDRDGVRFRKVSSAPADLPRFVLPDGAPARRTGAAVAAVAGALTPALRSSVQSIEALDPSSITLVIQRGRIVRWGSAARNADKVRILPMLLARRHVAQIDVTDPDQPFTRRVG